APSLMPEPMIEPMIDPALEIARIAGAAPTLVFLHEGLGSLSAWRDFPGKLASATGCAALVFSRAGYGRSPAKPGPWPVEFMHEEATALALDRDSILVGHSDGASIALLYAAAHPVRALVLLAPHVFVEDKTVASIAELGDEVRARLARHHAHADALFDAWRDVWLRPAFRRWNIEACLPRVRAPTLVIQGEDDEYGTVAQVDAIRQKLGAPCEALMLPDCGHAPHRDQPERTLAATTAFVQSIKMTSSGGGSA
ncbi:MAG TPA: alpha/beta hydrolase, partial [Polyangia bacterium]